MTRTKMSTALVALAVLGSTGCNSFLTGDKLTSDPNAPSDANISQSFVAVQAYGFGFNESTVPLTLCMWMQQCAGINGRFVQQFGRYNITEGSFSYEFAHVYAGGGLIDIRRVEAAATTSGDETYLGIAQVWEAFTIGTAADLWGDIPYTQAVGSSETPALDPQAAVYDSVQALLTRAITHLSSGVGNGPAGADLVFGDAPDVATQRSRWIAVAHSLKARFLLHTAEAGGATAYAAALAEAAQGIADPTGAGDFHTFHTGSTSERNIWFQFSQTTFGQDVVAGKALVDLMVARSDPRLPQYFGTNPVGGFGGQSPDGTQPDSLVSKLDGGRGQDETFQQPILTYVENELIQAEAYTQTGNDGLALQHLNNARATVPLGALAGITGAALVDSIMIEKYISGFQTIEVYSDYRRMCIPALVPYPTVTYNNQVPGRLYYGDAERNVNPNIPTPATQLTTNGFRNPNDPNSCP